MKKRTSISVYKSYILPQSFITNIDNKNLVIFPNIAKWIVLNNKNEFEAFNMISQGRRVIDIKKHYNGDELLNVLIQLEAKQIEQSVPKSSVNPKLHLHITNKCNFKCQYCYVNAGKPCADEMNLTDIKSIIDDFVRMGGKSMSFTGGEPTIRPDFLDMVKYASSKKLSISIFTNGTLWTKEMIKIISKCNVSGVQISLDGFNEETNSLTRGKNNFQKIVDTIELMVKSKIKVNVVFTPLIDNLRKYQKEYIEFSKRLLKKHKKNLQIDFTFELMPGRELSEEQVKKDKEEYFELIDQIVIALYGDVDKNSLVNDLKDDFINDTCGYGGLNIMANGDLYFCDRIPDAGKIANVKELSFNELETLVKKAGRLGLIENFEPCNKCELKYICGGGGCRAEHFKEFTLSTDLDKIDFKRIKPRECNNEMKEHYYRLMIEMNEFFYK